MPADPKFKPNPKLYRFMPLPEGFSPEYCTVEEGRSFAKCSRWTAFKKLREGRWRAVKDGRINKVIFATIKADMEALPERAVGSPPTSTKRPVGRPRKHPKPEPSVAAE
jgi:hypothetical protein